MERLPQVDAVAVDKTGTLTEGTPVVTDVVALAGRDRTQVLALAAAADPKLRNLRHLGLVVGDRQGRSIVYSLHDNHVAELLDQALFHVEQVRQGIRDEARAPAPR